MKLIFPALMMTLSTLPAVSQAAELQPQSFAEKAAISDMFEIEAAKIEIQNGKSDKIKAFAEEMVKDHGGSTHNLMGAAAKEGIDLPKALDSKHQEKLDALKPLSGVQLDAAYASTQISVHTEAVALFDAYSKDGKGGPLKAFAQQTYPIIRTHLVRIKGLNSGE